MEPLACREFSSTGVDGVSFHLLATNNLFDDESPVACCYPCEANTCVGGDLADFLALGCLRGFNRLAYAIGSPKSLIEFCTPSNEHDESIPSRVLASLREEFDLKPWANPVSKLALLQDEYGTLIQPPSDDELDIMFYGQHD